MSMVEREARREFGEFKKPEVKRLKPEPAEETNSEVL